METRVEDILVNARSLGGIGTTISFPEMDLTIDLGFCTPVALRTKKIAFTHTHLDHISGLMTYLGVRRLLGMHTPWLIVPEPMVQPLQDFVVTLGKLQGRPFEVTVTGARVGEDIQINKDLFLHPFSVGHPTPALGYVVVRRVRKLRQEFLGCSSAEIVKMREERGDEIFYVVEEPLVGVTGDSTAHGINIEDPLVRKARVLFIEATFLDERRNLADIHAGGHARLDEILGFVDRLESKTIVLYHFSQTYRTNEILEIISSYGDIFRNRKLLWLLPEEADRL